MSIRRLRSLPVAAFTPALALLTVACGAPSPAQDTTSASASALAGAGDDASTVDASTTVALADAATNTVRCSGVLLTPTVVATARACVAADRAGLRPVVLVGSHEGELRGHLAARDAVVLQRAGDAGPVGARLGGELALVFLDENDPVRTHARIPRPKLAMPNGLLVPGDANGSLTYPGLVASGWEPGAADAPACGTAGARKAFDLGQTPVSTYFPPAEDDQAFLVRSERTGKGDLGALDVGGPLFVEAPSGERQLVGVASAAGFPAAGSEVCGVSESGSCDVWNDVTSDPSRAFLVAQLRRAAMGDGSRFVTMHPPVNAGPDGVGDWWRGEVGYTGPCRSGPDPDCDGWEDFAADFTQADNCPNVFNPDQADADNDGIGDACECAAPPWNFEDSYICSVENGIAAFTRQARALVRNVNARRGALAKTPAGERLARELSAIVEEAERLLGLAAGRFTTDMAPVGGADLRAAVGEVAAARGYLDGVLSAFRIDLFGAPPGELACPARGLEGEGDDARVRLVARGYGASDEWYSYHGRTLADANGDGRADLIGFGPRGLEVALSDGARLHRQLAWTSPLGSEYSDYDGVYLYARSAADVDGDGRADLVAISEGRIFVARSTGAGFAPPEVWLTVADDSPLRAELYSTGFVVADANGDGRADVVAFAPSGVYVAEAGSGTFAAYALRFAANLGPDGTEGVARRVADVNGDGQVDLVSLAGGSLAVSLGSGGAFAAPVTTAVGLDGPLLLVDADGDGDLDAVAPSAAGLKVARNAGGVFAPAAVLTRAFRLGTPAWGEAGFTAFATGDVDGDGRADAVAFGADGVYVVAAARLPR